MIPASKMWKQGKQNLLFRKMKSDKSSPGFKSAENLKMAREWKWNWRILKQIKPEVFIPSPTPNIYRRAKHFRLPSGGVRHGPPKGVITLFFHFRIFHFFVHRQCFFIPQKLTFRILFKVFKEFFLEHHHPVCSLTFSRNRPRRNNRILTVQIWKLSTSSVLPFHLQLFLSEAWRRHNGCVEPRAVEPREPWPSLWSKNVKVNLNEAIQQL